jgi:hypothetical protein
MPDIQLITPSQYTGGGDVDPFPIGDYDLRFLAQGDSWFSIGAIPPWLTSNLFDQLNLSKSAVAVNCARPGAELVHMVDSTTSATFLRLLNGKLATRWTALLLSGLGNDVISAAQSPPSSKPHERLLARQGEWGPADTAVRYISEPGWATFDTHARQVFAQLLDSRDRTPVNRGLPIVVHTYDFTTPRNAAAGASFGPWLYKAVKAYGVPEGDWPALGEELLRRTGALIHSIAAGEPSVHVVDTQGTLTPAATTDTGPTVHWQNEIHPTRTGYRLLGDRWERELERLFCGP